MTKIKGSSYDEGVRDFTYTMVTKQLDWDLAFLGAKLSAMVARWYAVVSSSDEPLVPLSGELPMTSSGELLVTPSGEPLVTPPPPEVHPE